MVCPFNRKFNLFLKTGITPLSFRRFDAEAKRWQVHISKLVVAVVAAKRYFDHVDYSSLPEEVQLRIASLNSAVNTPQSKFDPTTPHEILFVLPSAPWEVIKAAYKALAQIHHPDHGGEAERFVEIHNAYEELRRAHEKVLDQ